MDIGGDPNESQATQLLQELLDNPSTSSKITSEVRGSGLRTNSGHSNEISSDSLPTTRNSNSHPQYHLHGLAASQTQAQIYEEEEEPNEGSQKENIGSSRSSKDTIRANAGSTSRASSPQASSSKLVQNKGSQMETRASTTGTAYKRATSATGALQTFQRKLSPSPIIGNRIVTVMSPHKPSASRRAPMMRPPSPSGSQDSFAGDPYGGDDLYEAKADKFNIPLSDLGEHRPPVREGSDATTGTSHLSSSSRGRSGPQMISLFSPLPGGNILVEATPTNSYNSRNEEVEAPSTQVETQLIEEPPSNQRVNQRPDQRGVVSGSQSSQASSEYCRFLDGERISEAEVEVDADAEIVATQPSTQVVFSSGDLPRDDLFAMSHVRSGPTPNSLLSMVPEKFRQRYLVQTNYQSPTTGPSSHRPVQDTQPSFPEQLAGQPLRSMPPSNIQGVPVRTRQRPVSPDSMEIVPDSEPSMEESPNKIFAPSAKQQKTNDKASAMKKRLVAKDTDVEMAPPDFKGKAKALWREEEEEEEEEEDVPLATIIQKAKGKLSTDKGKESSQMLPPSRGFGKLAADSSTAKGKKSNNTPKTTDPYGHSYGSHEVPSSLPEQDHPPEERILPSSKPEKPQSAKSEPTKASEKASVSARTRKKSGSKASNSKNRIKSEKEKDSGGDDADEDDTEQGQDEDEQAEAPKKRRRNARSVTATERATRGASKRSKNSSTPAPRQTRQLRSTARSTANRLNVNAATRVFALWKQNCHYYPGFVHSKVEGGKYTVHFDDFTEANVNLDQIRLGELHVGDDILFSNDNRGSKVIGVERQEEGYVQINRRGDEMEIPIKEVRIANKTVLYDWHERLLTDETIVPALLPAKPLISPSPSRASMASIGPIRGGKKNVLSKTGLIVTLTASGGNWEEEKERIMSSVRNSGGTVIDDLNSVLKMDGKYTKGNNGWIIKKADVKWTGHKDIERLFLVADEPNQKPKYLMALALGIPCLESTWLFDSVETGEEQQWLHFLLSQGFSQHLGARPSQQIDFDWANSVHHLKHIMKNAVPSKLFDGKSVLCVGPDMVPKAKKRNGEDQTDASYALPRVIIAMGAETVETVMEANYASKELAEYDYIVIREQHRYFPEYSVSTTVHWGWVKESLIASRHLPLPEWPSAEYSQEA